MAGLERKDKEFMKNLSKWEVIIMVETWLDEKGGERVRRRLPKRFKWEIQEAKKRKVER